ncbi:MAG TPA: hypothetical protein VFY10_03805 [Dehalococcoidia bacterium]|nr:hypothetical protein [Dehalococcoidia bacterium]
MNSTRFPLVPILASNALVVLAVLWVATAGVSTITAAIVGLCVAAVEIAVCSTVMRRQLEPEPVRGENRILSLMERSNEQRRTAIRDDSTGLLNRWYLDRRLDEEAARCKRYGYSMAIVTLRAAVLDLPGISVDGWQVEAAQAAHRAVQVIRNVDLSASLAPFEFALCLVHCDRDGAERVVERLVRELRDYDCSIGVSVYPDDNCEPAALIELARVRSHKVESSVA